MRWCQRRLGRRLVQSIRRGCGRVQTFLAVEKPVHGVDSCESVMDLPGHRMSFRSSKTGRCHTHRMSSSQSTRLESQSR